VVQDSGKALCLNTLKPLNLPEPVTVVESASGAPAAVRMPRRQVVTAVEDRWRIDDEWWRSEPLSRLYYAVRFKSGQRMVIFKDLNSENWYRQTY
jgi:hypothetical protein